MNDCIASLIEQRDGGRGRGGEGGWEGVGRGVSRERVWRVN